MAQFIRTIHAIVLVSAALQFARSFNNIVLSLKNFSSTLHARTEPWLPLPNRAYIEPQEWVSYHLLTANPALLLMRLVVPKYSNPFLPFFGLLNRFRTHLEKHISMTFITLRLGFIKTLPYLQFGSNDRSDLM